MLQIKADLASGLEPSALLYGEGKFRAVQRAHPYMEGAFCYLRPEECFRDH